MTIWDNINFSAYKRPKYTKYEISNLVKTKRKEEDLNTKDFVQKYEIEECMLLDIEKCTRSFNVRIYRACSKILGLTVAGLVSYDSEEPIHCENKDVQETVNVANEIFNEIIMQHKINV